MDIESVRIYALSLHEKVTEDIFAENWLSFRIGGKWFLLIQLDAPEPRVAVKMVPDEAAVVREQMEGVRPAYHMNKRHWSDLYLNELPSAFTKSCISTSFHLVFSQLPRRIREELENKTPR